jgi:hypothetical protein
MLGAGTNIGRSHPSTQVFPCVLIDFLKYGNIRSLNKELLERAFFNPAKTLRLGVGFGNY